MSNEAESTADLFGLEQNGAPRTAGLAGLARQATVPAQAPPTQPDGSSGELAIAPIDPAQITGTPAERIAALEAALDRATTTAAEGMRRTKARFVIETGTALRAIHAMQTELPGVLGMNWTQFVVERRQMSLSRAYQYMEAAPELQRVWTSKILEVPPNESQAHVLHAIIEHHGEDAARQTAQTTRDETGKTTAAGLTATAKKLGYKVDGRGQGERQQEPEKKKEQVRAPLDPLQEALEHLQQARRELAPRYIHWATTSEPEEAARLLGEIQAEVEKVQKRAETK